jgi:hypothetical protein
MGSTTGRAAFVLFMIAVAPLPAVAQICVPPPLGLVGWWPGNGNANDVIADNNGQLAGDATFAPAVVSQGFRLEFPPGRDR